MAFTSFEVVIFFFSRLLSNILWSLLNLLRSNLAPAPNILNTSMFEGRETGFDFIFSDSMLDLVTVLTKGGIVLWERSFFNNSSILSSSSTSSSLSLSSSSSSLSSSSSALNLPVQHQSQKPSHGFVGVHPIDALIKDVLIEERAGLSHYDFNSYRLKWCLANDLDLIFVVRICLEFWLQRKH